MCRYFLTVFAVFGMSLLVEASEQKIEVEIQFTPTETGLSVQYVTAAPLQEFHFDDPEGTGEETARPIRQQDWRLADAGFVFDGTTVKQESGAPFSHFTMLVAPDSRDHDRVYPAAYRMGESAYSIFSRHFFGDQKTFKNTLCIKNSASCDESRFAAVSNEDLVSGTYILVGEAPETKIGNMSIFVAPSTPAALAEAMTQSLVSSTEKIQTVLGYEPPTSSTVFLSYNKNGSGYRGSVTNGPTMILQLRGMGGQLDQNTVAQLQHFAAHEIVHFWNGGLFDTPEENLQSWLHEGSADYFAALVTSTPAQMAANGEYWLNACLMSLRNQPLNGKNGNVGGPAPYKCGAWIQWLADRALTHTTAGKHGAVELWRRIFKQAETIGDYTYSVPMFRETLTTFEQGAEIWALIQPLLDGTTEQHWVDPSQNWRLAGLRLTPKNLEQYDEAALRSHMMFALLDQYCTGSRGFYMEPDHFRLDTGDRCGVMSGDPIVREIGGFQIFGEAAGAFLHVQKACENEQSVVLSDTNLDTSLSVPCLRPMAHPRRQYTIEISEQHAASLQKQD